MIPVAQVRKEMNCVSINVNSVSTRGYSYPKKRRETKKEKKTEKRLNVQPNAYDNLQSVIYSSTIQCFILLDIITHFRDVYTNNMKWRCTM